MPKKKLEQVGTIDEPATPAVEQQPEEKPRAPKGGFSLDDMKDFVRSLFEETMPAMMAATVTALRRADAEIRAKADLAKNPGPKCQACGQFEVACKGEHRETVIFPKNTGAKWSRFFPGVYINGVRYLSTRPGQRIVVPKDSFPEGDAERWEKNEDEQATGREVEFNSGVISGRGNSVLMHADARNGWH